MISTLKTVLIGFSLSAAAFSFSQGGTVTSVVESNPPSTACTNTLLTVSGTHNFGGYTYTGATVTPSGSNLTITLNYTFGIGIAVITPFTQSVNIGMVPAANYTVTTNISVNGTGASPFTSLLNVVACCGAVPSFTPNATSVCVGDPIVLTNTSTGSTGQTWTDGSGFAYTSVDYSTIATVAGPMTFQLLVTDGTCSDSISQTINVLDIPTITSISSSPPQACSGEWFILTAASTGALTTSGQKWFIGGSQVSTGTTLQLSQIALGFLTVVHTVDNGACSVSDSITVEIVPQPTIDMFNVTNAICAGEMITGTSTSTGATSMTWYQNGVQVGTGATYSGTLTTPGATSIKLVVSNGGCLDSMEQTVNVNALPVVDLGPDTVFCVTPVTFDAGGGFTDYLWNDASTGQTLIANAVGTYFVTVTDANSCVGSDTVVVTSCLGIGELGLSNVSLYPNPTNGISTIEFGENVNQISVSIVNVLGQVVFTQNYTSVEKVDLDLSSLDSGIYVINLETVNGRNEIRLVKE